MLRSYTLYSLILLFPYFLFAQKHDNNWISGIKGNNTPIKGTQMSFTDNSVTYSQVSLKIEMRDYPITISDREGNLLFYTNGNVIASHNHQVMENSKGLNEGAQMDDFHEFIPDTTWNIEYIVFSYMVVPDPVDVHIYYLIHLYIIPGPAPGYLYASSKILCTKIDMSQNNGLGKVIYKNKVIYTGMMSPRLHMVKHGNGADWWIVTRSLDGFYYNTFHLCRDSIIQENIQEIYNPDNIATNWLDSNKISQEIITISPDGTKILDHYYNESARYLNFDRCTGMVSLIDTFAIGLDSFQFFNTSSQEFEYKISSLILMAFSPDNQFMYGCTVGGYSQWDLHATDLLGSRVQLTGPPYEISYDKGVEENVVYSPFFVNALDGKIYGLYRDMHYIINDPNKKGVACDFCYAPEKDPPTCIGFFSANSYMYSPWIPNYRLGPLEGSPCDTLSSTTHPSSTSFDIRIYPNPSSGPIYLDITLPEYSNKDVHIEVINSMGQVVHHHTFPDYAYMHTIEPGLLSSGMYYVRLLYNERQVTTERLVVME
jgi:hypothetical protein